MWLTLALLASTLAPSQGADLKLTNVHVTHGMLGPVRANESKILPGDALFLRYTIDGIGIDAKGKALYSTALKVTNSKGRVIFEQEPKNLEASNALGGRSMMAFAHVDIGLAQDPGKYVVEVTVRDRSNDKTQSLKHEFEVTEPGFGIVRLTTSTDPEALHQSAVFQAGGTLWINGSVVGFGRDLTTKQPKLEVSVKVLDETGRKVVFEAERGKIDAGVPEGAKALSGRFVLSLNRAGKFKVQIEAKDGTAGKTAQVAFPLRVLAVE